MHAHLHSLTRVFCSHQITVDSLATIKVSSHIVRPVNVCRQAKIFGEFSIIIPTFIVWRTHLVIDQFNFSSVFLCFSLFTISRQTSYNSGILRHDYGIKRWFTATVDKPGMPPVFFVMITELYKVCRWLIQ